MSNYVNGTTARQLNVGVNPNRQPVRISETTRKNRERVQKMSFGYVLVLTAALAIMGVMLVFYIGLQSQVKSSIKTISRMESELNNLKNSNDEAESRIKSDVDLEEIKQIAMGQLGMIYAQEGQIESFHSEDSDYVRQLEDIPTH